MTPPKAHFLKNAVFRLIGLFSYSQYLLLSGKTKQILGINKKTKNRLQFIAENTPIFVDRWFDYFLSYYGEFSPFFFFRKKKRPFGILVKRQVLTSIREALLPLQMGNLALLKAVPVFLTLEGNFFFTPMELRCGTSNIK